MTDHGGHFVDDETNMFYKQDQLVRYALSDDPNFDIARLKSIHGSKYIKILDTKTGRCKDIKPQEYVHLFSDNIERLREIIDGCISRNVLLEKSEIVDLLKNGVDYSIERLLDDLKIVNFKGDIDALPPNDVKIGDAYRVNGKVYIYFGICEKDNRNWKRVCFDNEMTNYYTKTEFDSLYGEQIAFVSSWLQHDVEEYTDDFYNRFMTKASVSGWISSAISAMQAYQESIAEMTAWRDEKATEIDQYEAVVNELKSNIGQIKDNINESVSAWIRHNQDQFDETIRTLSARYDELFKSISGIQRRIDIVGSNVDILSGEIVQIRSGKQKLLEVSYEA